MRRTGESFLKALRDRYEHPAEIAAYTGQVAGGLLAEEQAILARAVPRPCPVLVLGCGAGREAYALAAEGYAVTGADISQGMLRAARAGDFPATRIQWTWLEDPLHLPFAAHSFDLVTGFAQLLSHVLGAPNRVSLLSEIHRVLVPGGVFVGSFTDRAAATDLAADGPLDEVDPVDNSPSVPEDEYEHEWEEGDLLVWDTSEAQVNAPLSFHLHTVGEVTHECRAAGFREVRVVPARGLTPLAAPDADRFPFVLARKSVISPPAREYCVP